MDSLLRDLDRERGKMNIDIESFNQHYQKLINYVQEYVHQSTIEWAKLILNHPKTILLIVETTKIVNEKGFSYDNNHEPIRITTYAPETGEMWDQLLKPTRSRQVNGTQYHGLTMEDVQNNPPLMEVFPRIEEALSDKLIVIFGTEWAQKAWGNVIRSHHSLLTSAFDLHNKCKEYYGEFYELSLEKVLSYQGINKKREQLTDSKERILILNQVLHNLADGMERYIPAKVEFGEPPDEEEIESIDENIDFMDEHPF